MTYYSGFVLAVPTADREDYVAHARESWGILRRFGAVRNVECWGDDVRHGDVTDFPRAVRASADETVVFSWIEWPDRETVDRAERAMLDDPAMREIAKDMPFDAARMIVGGFTPVFDSATP